VFRSHKTTKGLFHEPRPQQVAAPVHPAEKLLIIIFSVELMVMLVLPLLELNEGNLAEPFVDSLLLSLVSAPLLWMVIIQPFRQSARQQAQRAESVLMQVTEGVIGCD